MMKEESESATHLFVDAHLCYELKDLKLRSRDLSVEL